MSARRAPSPAQCSVVVVVLDVGPREHAEDAAEPLCRIHVGEEWAERGFRVEEDGELAALTPERTEMDRAVDGIGWLVYICALHFVTRYNSQAGIFYNMFHDLSTLLLFLRRDEHDNAVVFFNL